MWLRRRDMNQPLQYGASDFGTAFSCELPPVKLSLQDVGVVLGKSLISLLRSSIASVEADGEHNEKHTHASNDCGSQVRCHIGSLVTPLRCTVVMGILVAFQAVHGRCLPLEEFLLNRFVETFDEAPRTLDGLQFTYPSHSSQKLMEARHAKRPTGLSDVMKLVDMDAFCSLKPHPLQIQTFLESSSVIWACTSSETCDWFYWLLRQDCCSWLAIVIRSHSQFLVASGCSFHHQRVKGNCSVWRTISKLTQLDPY